jgi:hypothetical protein
MTSLGRLLILLGISLVLGGALFLFAGRSNFPFGQLPGDIRIQGENFACFIPLATSIILSILLTIVLNLVARYLNK